MNRYRFRESLAAAMDIAREGNKYLAETEPWKLIKSDTERTKEILFNALQICAQLSVAFEPFLPNTSNKLRGLLNIAPIDWKNAINGNLVSSGHTLGKPGLLFEKIDDIVIEKQMLKLEESRKVYKELTAPSSSTVKTQKSDITFDEFSKMDIRVGTILAAEKVEKADKLLKLTVDTGIDQRMIVSGIAEHYTPEEVIGKKVSVLINLAPRKIRGVESKGMILMAENAEGKLCFISPVNTFDSGSEIR